MITKTKGVCGGSACIEGSRIPVWLIVATELEGVSVEAIATFFCSDTLTVEHVRAALRYAVSHPREIAKEIVENSDPCKGRMERMRKIQEILRTKVFPTPILFKPLEDSVVKFQVTGGDDGQERGE